MDSSDIKKHFEHQYTTNAFFSPRDIEFAIYSKEIWGYAKSLLKESKRVVDLGAGGATVLYNISRISQAELIAVDFSKNALTMVKKILPKARLFEENALNTSLEDEFCDFCISTMLIEHVDETKFLKEVYRIIKPHGYFLITTVLRSNNAHYFYKNKRGEPVLEPSHLREYTSLENFLLLLRNCGFSILKTKTPRIKFPVIDPFIKIVFRLFKNELWQSIPSTKPIEFLRKMLRFPIPGYYAIEVVVQKRG